MQRERVLILVLVGVGIALVGYLVFAGLQGQQQYYLHLDELQQMKSRVDGRGVRINARVAPGSIRKQPGTLDYTFVLTDGTHRVTVHYRGAVSDLFKDNAEVVVEGRYDARRNHIEATRLLTKCPSKYQADTVRASRTTRSGAVRSEP